MIITTKYDLPITVTKDGKQAIVRLKPGSRDYKDIDHKDPAVATQLSIYRKHGRIGFDEIVTVPDVKQALAPSPLVTVPVPKDPGTPSPNRKKSAAATKAAAAEEVTNDPGHGTDDRSFEDIVKDIGSDQGDRPVSGKKKH